MNVPLRLLLAIGCAALCACGPKSGPPPNDAGSLDGGGDAGFDAGTQPADGGSVGLIAVADETSIALAWTPPALASPWAWEVDRYDGGAGTAVAHVGGSSLSYLQSGVGAPDASVTESLFVVGRDDAGAVALGLIPDGGGFETTSLVSSLRTVTTGTPTFSADIPVTSSAVSNAVGAAIDSARQFYAVEQAGSGPTGFFTQDRGQSFASHAIDSAGTNIRLAYEPSAGVLFACFNSGAGVRVRSSLDLGRTWPSSVDITNPSPADGGLPQPIQDCDLAPWGIGQAQVVTGEIDRLTVRAVDAQLNLGAPTVAFLNSTDGGYVTPSHPRIAARVNNGETLIGFTALQNQAGNTVSKVVSVYEDSSTGGFLQPAPIGTPSPFSEDNVTLAIDPVTGRAVAAYVTSGTVYVSLFSTTTHQWATGSDLNVLVNSGGYYVVPGAGSGWNALAPSFSVTPAGKIFLAFAAGQSPTLHPYVVGFDLAAKSPLSTGTGWFVPYAQQVSASSVAVGPVLVADTQLSVYAVFVEAPGPGRPIAITRP